jgi:HEAT repeat protein
MVRDITAETAGIAAGSITGGVTQENFNGLVIKRLDGNLIYQALVGEEQVTFDALEVENDYLDRVAKSELATVATMLGRVPIEKLTVPSYLLPIKPGRDAVTESSTAISRESALRATEALSIAPRLVIVAGPGMGKTTFLNAVATSLATRRTGDIPVPISLYRYVTESKGRPLIDFALETRFAEMYKGKELEAFGEVFRRWNRDGKLLFLLDGLDEVAEDRRRALVDQFAALTRFVLTTRPIGRVDAYQPQGGTLQMLPLDDRDVSRFVYQWAALDGVGAAFEPRTILRIVRRDDRLADLARVPQLLGLVCFLWSRGAVREFRTRADLFAQTTDSMIAKGLDQLDVREEERETLPRGLRRWLRKLALDMLAHPAGPRLRVSRDAMLDDLEIGRSDNEAARLFRLAQASGLIVRALDGVDDFQFVHLAFQEYLAAEALAASEDPTGLIARLQHRAAFEEPVRMACAVWADRGEDDRINVLLRGIISPDQADRFGSNVLLAGMCLGEIERAEQRFPDLVATVEESLLDHASHWWLRERFASVIAQLKTDGMRRRLMAGLESEQFHLRWAAAVALGLMGDPSTLGPIVDRLNVEQSDAISTSLIDAIAAIGSAEAVPFLMEVLEWVAKQPEPDVFMSSAIGAALARLGATEELASLTSKFDSEPVADAVMEALRYLPPAQASRLVETLNAAGTTVRFSSSEEFDPGPSLEEVEVAAQSDEADVRIAAAREYGRIGNSDARRELLGLLADGDPAVVESAANELENAWSDGFGLLASIDELATFLASSPDVNVAFVVRALWDLPATRDATTRAWDEKASGPDDRASAIATLTEEEDEVLRAAAACILGLFRATGQRAELGRLAEADASSEVRRHAIWALGRIGDPAVLPSLLNLREGSGDQLEAVADALASIGSPDGVPRLAELARHQSAGVRRRAVAALAMAGDERVVEPLLRALDDDNRDVRLAAMRSLAAVSDPRSTKQLLGLLLNEDADVRAAAATGLQSARGDEVDATLGRVAEHDEAPQVVYAALESLGQAGRGERAAASLAALLTSDAEEIRVEACRALGDLGSMSMAPKLKLVLAKDPSETVRDFAADAFGRLSRVSDIVKLIDDLKDPDDVTSLGAVTSHLSSHPDTDMAEISARLATHHIALLARPDRASMIIRTPHADTKWRNGTAEDHVPAGDDPVDFYVGQLAADDVPLRWDAADALGRLRAVEAIPSLVGALLDADPIVAYEAARSIEQMTRDEGLRDAAAMALAAATTHARDAGFLPDLIHLLVEERADEVTSVTRDLLSVPEAMCELLAYESNDDDISAVLWTIAERYNLRFMPDGVVIMPNGERLSCEAARQRLGVA